MDLMQNTKGSKSWEVLSQAMMLQFSFSLGPFILFFCKNLIILGYFSNCTFEVVSEGLLSNLDL